MLGVAALGQEVSLCAILVHLLNARLCARASVRNPQSKPEASKVSIPFYR